MLAMKLNFIKIILFLCTATKRRTRKQIQKMTLVDSSPEKLTLTLKPNLLAQIPWTWTKMVKNNVDVLCLSSQF
jgi:hypothetical protein